MGGQSLGQGWASGEQSLGWGTFVPEQPFHHGMMCSRGALNLLAAFPQTFLRARRPRGLQQARAVFFCGSRASGECELPGETGQDPAPRARWAQVALGPGRRHRVGSPGTESGQDAHCHIVSVTLLPGRWDLPPAGALGGLVSFFPRLWPKWLSFESTKFSR